MRKTEFQFIKMLSVDSFREYIEFLESIFSFEEINETTNWIILTTQGKRT